MSRTKNKIRLPSLPGRGQGSGQAGRERPGLPRHAPGRLVGDHHRDHRARGPDQLRLRVGRADPGEHPPDLSRSDVSGTDWNSSSWGWARRTLEPDDGTPVPIEQPTAIMTPPLSEKDQDDRVRMAFGLTHDDPLPEV